SVLTALLTLWVLAAHVSPAFTPVRSELTNARGFSRGILNFVILPGDAPFARAPWWSVFACGAAFLLLITVRLKPHATLPTSRVSTFLKFLHVGAVGFLLAVAASSLLSPYRVVLAPRTFVLCLLIVCLALAF